jgi:hypothetical protein
MLNIHQSDKAFASFQHYQQYICPACNCLHVCVERNAIVKPEYVFHPEAGLLPMRIDFPGSLVKLETLALTSDEDRSGDNPEPRELTPGVSYLWVGTQEGQVRQEA